MTSPPSHPKLTPKFCLSSTALQDFLRASRSTIDDSITSNLNALLTPASTGFDPSSTRTRIGRSGNKVPASSCAAFKENVLFPSWKSRDEVLVYCSSVAETVGSASADNDTNSRIEEHVDERLKVVDNRSDPYENRPQQTYGAAERLKDLIWNERGVERIVRTRTWGIVSGRCADDGDEESREQSWVDAMRRWELQR